MLESLVILTTVLVGIPSSGFRIYVSLRNDTELAICVLGPDLMQSIKLCTKRRARLRGKMAMGLGLQTGEAVKRTYTFMFDHGTAQAHRWHLSNSFAKFSAS